MRWIFSFRYIDDIDADRARQRFTLNYRFTTDIQAGIEWNPLDDDWGPLANWTILRETRQRPAFIVGTSSDRIGTSSGQSYYGTLSKNLHSWLDVSISPYAGAAFADRDDDWDLVGGLNYWLFDQRISVTHIWDGENLHLTVDYPWQRHLFGIFVAQQEDPDPNEGKDYFLGVTYGLRFPSPGFLRELESR